MRDHRPLANEEQFHYSGPDWLLLLLDQCHGIQRDLTMHTLWHSWSVHNNITHQLFHKKNIAHQLGACMIVESVHYLINLWSSLTEIRQSGVGRDDKGKANTCDRHEAGPPEQHFGKDHAGRWSPGWSKINVDGSFLVVDDDFVNVLDSQKCHI
jgi:hypothetical protein